MKKSVVAGVAGSVRLAQLDMAKLRTAERHGKREDRVSQIRVIRDVPPLTTTGLNLRDLYDAHVRGCFVPRAKTKAIHAIVQFPKDLDVPDDEALLDHAVRFAEGVWGTNAVFATRLDRDEKSSRVVDLFMAPKYLKVTKADPLGKMAIAMTRHGKELAKKYNRVSGKTETKYNPVSGEIEEGKKFTATWDVGRAIQDEFHRYLRDEMGLVGVARGAPKAQYGPDWESSEELRAQELDDLEAQLRVREKELDDREAALELKEAKVRIEEASAFGLMTEVIPRLRQKAEADGYADGKASAKSEAEEARKTIAEEKMAAEEERRRAEEKRIEQEKLLSAANGERMRLAAARADIEQQRREAADEKKAAEARRHSIEAGLIAMLEGDVVGGRISPDGLGRLIVVKRGLSPEKQAQLGTAMRPAWSWISEQAERLADAVRAKFEAREEEVARRELAIREEAARLRTQKKDLEESWDILASLMDQAKRARAFFNAAIAPLAEWKTKFDEATGLQKQVMSFGPKTGLADDALSDASVKGAQNADSEFEALLASHAAMKGRNSGWGR